MNDNNLNAKFLGIVNNKIKAQYLNKIMQVNLKAIKNLSQESQEIISYNFGNKYDFNKKKYQFNSIQNDLDYFSNFNNIETYVNDLPNKIEYDNSYYYRKGEIIIDKSNRISSIYKLTPSKSYQCLSINNSIIIIPPDFIISSLNDDNHLIDFNGNRICTQDKLLIIDGTFKGSDAIALRIYDNKCLVIVNDDIYWVSSNQILLKNPFLNDPLVGESVLIHGKSFVIGPYLIIGYSKNKGILIKKENNIIELSFKDHRKTWLFEKEDINHQEYTAQYSRNYQNSSTQQSYIQIDPIDRYNNDLINVSKGNVIYDNNIIPLGSEGIVIEVPQFNSLGVINKIEKNGIIKFQLIHGKNMDFKSYSLTSNEVKPIIPSIGDLCLLFIKDIPTRAFLEKIQDNIATLKDERHNGPIYKHPIEKVFKIFSWEED